MPWTLNLCTALTKATNSCWDIGRMRRTKSAWTMWTSAMSCTVLTLSGINFQSCPPPASLNARRACFKTPAWLLIKFHSPVRPAADEAFRIPPLQHLELGLYKTVGRPSVSVCLSHRSTAAAACGGFAAERDSHIGRKTVDALATCRAAVEQKFNRDWSGDCRMHVLHHCISTGRELYATLLPSNFQVHRH